MPAWIADIASLESLEIEEAHGVSELLPSLWRLRELRQLKLACTWDLTALLLSFEGFPAGLEQLSKLEDIHIWGAKSLSALPEYLGYMPSLKCLRISGCSSLKGLPKFVRERKDLHVDVRFCGVQVPE